MKQFLYILICAITLTGCKDQADSSSREGSSKPISNQSVSEPNAVALEEAVLTSMNEFLEDKRGTEATAILELQETGVWKIGGRQVTQDEIKEIPIIQKDHDMPLNVQLHVFKGMQSQENLVSVIDSLKLSGALKVSIATPK